MKPLRCIGTYLLWSTLGSLSQPVPALSQTSSVETKPQPTGTVHDGQHDFDFEIGTWKIHLSRLQDRLVGSKTWVEFDGTSEKFGTVAPISRNSKPTAQRVTSKV